MASATTLNLRRESDTEVKGGRGHRFSLRVSETLDLIRQPIVCKFNSRL